jgi:DNA-binding transcriptional LysR family regulator
MAKVRAQAPSVAVEWSTPGSHTAVALADGQIDIAMLSSATNVPEGVVRQDAGALRVRTYLRKEHPAIASWGLAEWVRWPHVQVMLGDRQRTTVDTAINEGQIRRTTGARVPHFSCVPELLARTDMLATLPLLLSEDLLEKSKLRALEPPMPIAPVPLSYFWSFRLSNDPGAKWIRSIVMEAFEELQRRTPMQVA